MTATPLWRWLRRLILAGCMLYAGVFVFHGAWLALYPFDVDNSEAYLVYQGQRLAEGEFLYPPLGEPPYLVDNYPPVYPLGLAAGFVLTGPNFHWPRILSLSSTCLTALILGLWAFSLTRNRFASVLSVLIYLSFYHVYDWGALGRVDALGVLFAVTGLYWFARSSSWKAALPFFVLALFTRQTLFAAPAAVFMALSWNRSEKASLWYLGSLVGTGLMLFLCLVLATSGRVWEHLVVYNANAFRFVDVWNYARHWVYMYPVWGTIPVLILLMGRNQEKKNNAFCVDLLFWFTLFAMGEALLCGKIGSAPNYLLSLVAATAVGFAVVYHRFECLVLGSWKTVSLRTAGLFFLLACIFQLVMSFHWPFAIEWYAHTPRAEDWRAGRYLQLQLRQSEGPVLSDLAGVPLLAGHPPVFQPFICTQLARQGVWDPAPLLKRIEKQEFPQVVFRFALDGEWDRERFTAPMIEVLRANYRLQRQIGGYFLYEPINDSSP